MDDRNDDLSGWILVIVICAALALAPIIRAPAGPALPGVDLVVAGFYVS
jgi:hypothetical protein